MAEDDQGSWDAIVKRRALWLQSFWFVRGVMGTMALVALIPQVTELEQIEVLRALYVLIIGWNDVMGWLGQFIGEFSWLPVIPAEWVSGTVFCATILFPCFIGYVRALVKRSDSLFPSFVLRAGKQSLRFLLFSVGHIVVSSGTFVLILFLYMYLMSPNPGGVIAAVDWSPPMIAGVLLASAGFIFVAAEELHGLRSGILFTLGVIATITIGYNIGTTEFSEWVNATVCAELNIAPADCSPD